MQGYHFTASSDADGLCGNRCNSVSLVTQFDDDDDDYAVAVCLCLCVLSSFFLDISRS